MKSSLQHLAEKLLESGWLIALIVVPTFFNLQTLRIFEEEKALLLRSLAVFLCLVAAILLLEQGMKSLLHQLRSIWRLPLVRWCVLSGALYLLSTAWSIAPSLSFWGTYVRRQGTLTNLSYMVFFFLILLLLRSRQQLNRLLTAVMLASVPAALYAVLQHWNMDPISWDLRLDLNITGRVSSVSGHPIFLAAYLVMVVPLTVAKLIEHFEDLVTSLKQGGTRQKIGPSLFSLTAYLLLLGLQMMAIAFTESRGPMLGLLVGLFFFVFLYTLLRGWMFLTLTATGLLVGGALLLVLLNLPNLPLMDFSDSPYIGRFSNVLENESGSAQVRILIGKGVFNLLRADTLRTLIGYGPETLSLVYLKYASPQLINIARHNPSVDRSHNELLDLLAMQGVAGLLVWLLLLGSFFYHVLHWLGLIQSKGSRNVFFALLATGGVMGWFLPYLLTDGFFLSAVGMAAGMMGAVTLYLAAFALTHRGVALKEHPHGLLLIALLAAVSAHFVELQFGIPTVTTRLYFWTYLGLAVVLGLPLLGLTSESLAGKATGHEDDSPTGEGFGSSVVGFPVLGVLAGGVVSVVIFDFINPDFQLSRLLIVVTILCLGTCFFSVLFTLGREVTHNGQNLGLKHLWLLTTQILGVGGLYLLFHSWVQGGTLQLATEGVLNEAANRANAVTMFYLWVCCLVVVLAVLLLPNTAHSARLTHARLKVWFYPILLFLSIPIVAQWNLRASWADVYENQARIHELSGQWVKARWLHEKAIELQPAQDQYRLHLGSLFLSRSRYAASLEERWSLFKEGLEVFDHAHQLNPFSSDHLNNMANLARSLANLAGDPEAKDSYFEQSEWAYSEAVKINPNNAALWNDWAQLATDRKEVEAALQRLNRALELDPNYDATYHRLGNHHLNQQAWELARQNYLKAVELNGLNVEAWSALGLAYLGAGDPGSAIEANHKVLDIKPDDFAGHKNLALLYRQIADLEHSMEHAQRALQLAPVQEVPALRRFLQETREATERGQ